MSNKEYKRYRITLKDGTHHCNVFIFKSHSPGSDKTYITTDDNQLSDLYQSDMSDEELIHKIVSENFPTDKEYNINEVSVLKARAEYDTIYGDTAKEKVKSFNDSVSRGDLKSELLRNSDDTYVTDGDKSYNCKIIETIYSNEKDELMFKTEQHIDDSKNYFCLIIEPFNP